MNQKELNQSLIDACQSKNIERIKVLIEAGADVNIKSNDYTLIMLVCHYFVYKNTEISTKIEVIELLINFGANVNVKNKYGDTALMIVSKVYSESNTKIIKLLVNNGADINVQSELCIYYPLTWAIYHGNIKIVKFLIEKNANINPICNIVHPPPLTLACQKNHYNLVKLLIEKGADVNKQSFQNIFKSITPLIVACEEGNIEIVKLLISKGADVNASGARGYNILTNACKLNNLELVKILLASGADAKLDKRYITDINNEEETIFSQILIEIIAHQIMRSESILLIIYDDKIFNDEQIKSIILRCIELFTHYKISLNYFENILDIHNNKYMPDQFKISLIEQIIDNVAITIKDSYYEYINSDISSLPTHIQKKLEQKFSLVMKEKNSFNSCCASIISGVFQISNEPLSSIPLIELLLKYNQFDSDNVYADDFCKKIKDLLGFYQEQSQLSPNVVSIIESVLNGDTMTDEQKMILDREVTQSNTHIITTQYQMIIDAGYTQCVKDLQNIEILPQELKNIILASQNPANN